MSTAAELLDATTIPLLSPFVVSQRNHHLSIIAENNNKQKQTSAQRRTIIAKHGNKIGSSRKNTVAIMKSVASSTTSSFTSPSSSPTKIIRVVRVMNDYDYHLPDVMTNNRRKEETINKKDWHFSCQGHESSSSFFDNGMADYLQNQDKDEGSGDWRLQACCSNNTSKQTRRKYPRRGSKTSSMLRLSMQSSCFSLRNMKERDQNGIENHAALGNKNNNNDSCILENKNKTNQHLAVHELLERVLTITTTTYYSK